MENEEVVKIAAYSMAREPVRVRTKVPGQQTVKMLNDLEGSLKLTGVIEKEREN